MLPAIARHMPASLLRGAERQARSLSGVGLMLGTLFFAASLTPSLIPRSPALQGALAGACLAAGYGLGVFWRWLWAYLELPEPPEVLRRRVNRLLVALCLFVAVFFLWRSAEWQNSIRVLMALPPVTSGHPVKVCAIAVFVAILLLALGRLFILVMRIVSGAIRRVLPRRLAQAIGLVAAMALFWSIGSEVLFRAVFQVLDASYRRFDALMEVDRPQPTDPGKTGSAASLVRWDELGRAGREFIDSGPHAGDIAAVTGRPAQEPLRVYVGLRAADDPQARAKLALAELKRQNAFARSILLVVTPTGTGWVDPAALDPVEYLHDGDIASVAVQYSYLSSPLSLLVQPEMGDETARALFSEVYAYWTSLPKDHRPRLYLHGLSLGALNSERSAGLLEMVGDPVDGALWAGPPFASRLWRSVTDARVPGSPEWLPRFRDDRFVRFMNQDGGAVPPDRPWGALRVVYLQYASDPVVFFAWQDIYRRPAWMTPPRGPDVSAELRWYPVVTFLQLAVDAAVAASSPMGHGHVYAPQHYLDAWVAVTGAPGWTPDRLAALRQHLVARFAGSEEAGSSENRGG